jgi:hypothetical protein
MQTNRDVEFLINGTELRGLSRQYPRQEVLAIPEGVEAIGKEALTQANCEKLAMPYTLKEIKERAFFQAKIDEIDFGDCKLQRIGIEAFSGCKAKTELPDTIEEIDRGGIDSLAIKKGKTLKLPSSLRDFYGIGVSLKDVEVLEIGEKMLTNASFFERSTQMLLGWDEWITVRVTRMGALICEFVILGDYEGYYSGYKLFDSLDVFSYKKYDEKVVSKIKSLPCKVNAAALRLLLPIDLSSEYELHYRKYVKKNFLKLIQGKEEDIETIRKYDEAGFVTIYRLKQLLKLAVDKQNVEVSAFLVDLIGRKEGARIKSLKL